MPLSISGIRGASEAAVFLLPHQGKRPSGRFGGRSIDLRRALIRRRTTPVICRKLCQDFRGLIARASRPRCLKSSRLLGVTRAWIEPPASLPVRGAENLGERGPLRPRPDEQSSDLEDQLRALERSQTLY